MFHPELTEDRARGPHKSAAFVGRGGARKRNGVFAVRRKRSGADFAPTRSEGPFLFPQKKKWTLPLPGRHPPEGLRPPQGGTLPAPGGHWPPLHKGGMAHRAAAPTDGHSTRRAGPPPPRTGTVQGAPGRRPPQAKARTRKPREHPFGRTKRAPSRPGWGSLLPFRGKTAPGRPGRRAPHWSRPPRRPRP